MGEVVRHGKDSDGRGRRAESWAVMYVRLKGYSILKRRWKTPVGEIDIIARRGGTVCFMEVKYRTSQDAAAEAVAPKQQARIARAAEHFLSRYPELQSMDLRFDAILLAPRRWPRHVMGAWTRDI